MNTLRARIKAPSLLSGENVSPTENPGLSTTEPVQVEPKTFFANERTFIQWISASLLLLTVSSIMMSGGGYNGTSGVIAFAALVLVTYSSYVYFRRVNLLMSGKGFGYLDIIGPTILAAGVGLGVLIVFADSVAGSEIIGKGGKDKDEDDRRSLMAQAPALGLQEVPDLCTHQSLQGLNLLEFEPKDLALAKGGSELLMVTPQSCFSHSLLDGQKSPNSVVANIPDTELESIVAIGDQVFSLSVGPSKTELLRFASSEEDNAETNAETHRFLVSERPHQSGSVMFVPSATVTARIAATSLESGKFYIRLDDEIHVYKFQDAMGSLVRTNTLNNKVLQGNRQDSIVAMTHWEGLTYLLYSNRLEAWDFDEGKYMFEVALPITEQDSWVGLALDRRPPTSKDGYLRNQQNDNLSKVVLYMVKDSFPPQVWSFVLKEQTDKSLLFPDCGQAMA